MRKYLIALAAMLMVSGYGLADEMKPVKSDTGKKESVTKDYFMKEGGKMMVVKDGKKTALDTGMSMPNGILLMEDGTYIMEDGTLKVMKEGDRMDMDGNAMSGKK